MSKRYSVAAARDNFAAIVHELETTNKVEITRRGLPVAVLVSKQEYDRLQSRRVGFWNAYKAYARQVNLAKLGIESSEVFAGLRERGSGRRVEL